MSAQIPGSISGDPGSGPADEPLLPEVLAIAAEIAPDLVAIRRHLHAHPELGFQEVETSALVRAHLQALGLAPRSGFGKTGVAALIGEGNGPVIGIRGDMDALPIEETGTPDYRSTRPGLMHACGHDAHTAIALGVATVMARLTERLPGRAFLIFQPAEEGLGGARAMIADGLLDWVRPDVMLGYHNWPLLPGGTVGYHPAAAFAATDPFDILLAGRSGHGAHPHLAVDPIVAAAGLVTALQQIVAREVAPLEAAVVTVGRIEGGTARNQIPDQVRLQGTVRTQTPAVRERVLAALARICEGIGTTHRVACTLDLLPGTPPVVNDPAILSPVLQAVRDTLGAGRVVELPQGSMGSEDYAEFSARIPSAHLRIGSRVEGRETMLHRSDFDLDESCIPTAVAAVSAAALRMMRERGAAGEAIAGTTAGEEGAR